MLTEEEKWLFDLHGYLILRQVVTPQKVQRMVELCDTWHALDESELPPPLKSYHSSVQPTNPRYLDHVEYGDELFDQLILNREVMRVVLAITDNCPQHMKSSLARTTKNEDAIGLHNGSHGGLRNPANDYQAADGRLFATFLNAALSLVDVPPGNGFVCIPGSHKSHFERPDDVDVFSPPPLVANVSLNAGDVVLFTELLCHGAFPWTMDDPRRTVFVRYSTSYASWMADVGPFEEHRDKISEEVYELKQRSDFQSRKKVVERLLEELG